MKNILVICLIKSRLETIFFLRGYESTNLPQAEKRMFLFSDYFYCYYINYVRTKVTFDWVNYTFVGETYDYFALKSI